MLFTKPIQGISFDDVVDFCRAGNAEGFILEYKRDFPSDNEAIAKTIAAFANTYGGILIIGADAPKGVPIAYDGITYDPSLKYAEKIESICLAHIQEPVFPEIQVCQPQNNKTFVVVRVAESALTPHRVSNNRRVYVRTGQSSTPNNEATWEKVEWLAQRRRKSEELRETLIQRAETYFKNACLLRGIEDPYHTADYFAVLTLLAIPLSPQGPLVDYRQFGDIHNDIRISGHHPFPILRSQPLLIQDGVHRLDTGGASEGKAEQCDPFTYIHLNAFGLYFYKEDIGERKDNVPTLYFHRVVLFVHQFLVSSAKFYQKIGFWGTVQINIGLQGGLGTHIPHPLSRRAIILDGDSAVPSSDLAWKITVSVPRLTTEFHELVIETVEDIGWSLGLRYIGREQIEQILKDLFGE